MTVVVMGKEKACDHQEWSKMCRLIKSTGPQKSSLFDVINEFDGSLIHSQELRLGGWIEHFKEKFRQAESNCKGINAGNE